MEIVTASLWILCSLIFAVFIGVFVNLLAIRRGKPKWKSITARPRSMPVLPYAPLHRSISINAKMASPPNTSGSRCVRRTGTSAGVRLFPPAVPFNYPNL